MVARENVKTDLTRINSLTSFHDYLQFGRMLHPVVGPNDSGKKLWHFSIAPPTQRSVKATGGLPNLGFCISSSKGVSDPTLLLASNSTVEDVIWKPKLA